MSHVDQGPLPAYNSLADHHLAGYFTNTRMRRHLRKAGLVNKYGEIVTENTYRLNMSRREHKQHVKDMLAQAIVHKTLDLERTRQSEIRKKLEEIAKIELVRRVRASRYRKRDTDILPYISPRSSSSRPSSGPDAHQADRKPGYGDKRGRRVGSAAGSRSSRPISDPPRNRKRRPMSALSSNYDEDDEGAVVYLDDEGRPITPAHVDEANLRFASKDPIDTRHLYSLDTAALRKYALLMAKMEQGRGGASPYLIPQVPLPPKSPKSSRNASARRTPRSAQRYRGEVSKSSSPKRPSTANQAYLHPAPGNQKFKGQQQTMCQVSMVYHGSSLSLAREMLPGRTKQDVVVEQQHCGGNTLTVFRDCLDRESDFSFISYRHRGYPFSLSIYIDGKMDCRVSTCCEYRHQKGGRIGGKKGHFSISGIQGAVPCYKCQVEKGIRVGNQAPRPKLKRPPENQEEVVVIETAREPEEEKPEPEPAVEAAKDEQILVPVEDGEDTKADDKYDDDDFESSDASSSAGEGGFKTFQPKDARGVEKTTGKVDINELTSDDDSDKDKRCQKVSSTKQKSAKKGRHSRIRSASSKSYSSSSSSSDSESEQTARGQAQSKVVVLGSLDAKKEQAGAPVRKVSPPGKSNSGISTQPGYRGGNEDKVEVSISEANQQEPELTKKPDLVVLPAITESKQKQSSEEKPELDKDEKEKEDKEKKEDDTPRKRSDSSFSSSSSSSSSSSKSGAGSTRDYSDTEKDVNELLKAKQEHEEKKEKEMENDFQTEGEANKDEKPAAVNVSGTVNGRNEIEMEEEDDSRKEGEGVVVKGEVDGGIDEDEMERMRTSVSEQQLVSVEVEEQMQNEQGEMEVEAEPGPILSTEQEIEAPGSPQDEVKLAPSSTTTDDQQKDGERDKKDDLLSAGPNPLLYDEDLKAPETEVQDEEKDKTPEKRPSSATSTQSSSSAVSSSSSSGSVVLADKGSETANNLTSTPPVAAVATRGDENQDTPVVKHVSLVTSSPDKVTIAGQEENDEIALLEATVNDDTEKKEEIEKRIAERRLKLEKEERQREKEKGAEEEKERQRKIEEEEEKERQRKKEEEDEKAKRAAELPSVTVSRHGSDSSSVDSSDDSDTSDGESNADSRKKGNISAKTGVIETEADVHASDLAPSGKDQPNTTDSPGPDFTDRLLPKVEPGSIQPLLEKSRIMVEIKGVPLNKAQLSECAEYIKSQRQINQVNLVNCELEDDDIQRVVTALKLSHSNPVLVNLSLNPLSSGCVDYLLDLLESKPSIEAVLLQGTRLGDAGVEQLVTGLLSQHQEKKTRPNSKELQELDLSDCKMGDDGAQAVARLLSSDMEVDTLTLSSNEAVSESGWAAIGDSLTRNTTLETLTLDHNLLGDPGVKAITSGLQENTCVTALDLNGVGITEIGGRALVELLKRNTTLLEITVADNSRLDNTVREEIGRYIALNKTMGGSQAAS